MNITAKVTTNQQPATTEKAQSEILKGKQKRPNQDGEDGGRKETTTTKPETTGYGGEEPRSGRQEGKDRKMVR